jgi:hypothetical protein
MWWRRARDGLRKVDPSLFGDITGTPVRRRPTTESFPLTIVNDSFALRFV